MSGLRRIDYDAYYRWLAYQRWLSEKKKRERRRRIAGAVAVLIVVLTAVYLSLPDGEPGAPAGNGTSTYLNVPASVKVIPAGGGFEAVFNVYFPSRPPMLVVTNYPACKVSYLNDHALVECRFDSLKTTPDVLTLFDGSKYYKVSLDKYAVASFVEQPSGGFFAYKSVAYYGDNVSVSFTVVSDRPLAKPEVTVYGVSGAKYEYSTTDENGRFYYAFKVMLYGVRSSTVRLLLYAENLRKPLGATLDFELTKRQLSVEKLFSEPVVVVPGKVRTVSFSVVSNYNTLVKVVVPRNPLLSVSSPGSVPVIKGNGNVVSIAVSEKNATKIEKTTLTVVLEDSFFKKVFTVPVIVIPPMRFSIAGLNTSYNPDGSINVTLAIKSSVDVDAVVKYTSSPASVSPEFPMSVTLKKGVNLINFKVKGYPASADKIDIMLTLQLYAYGVHVTDVDVELTINLGGGK